MRSSEMTGEDFFSFNFHPHDDVLSWVLAVVMCLSVYLSITCRYFHKGLM